MSLPPRFTIDVRATEGGVFIAHVRQRVRKRRWIDVTTCESPILEHALQDACSMVETIALRPTRRG